MEILNNRMKQIRVKYGVVLALLAVIVCLCTGILLGRDAETLTYPMNCTYKEHLHDENCYTKHSDQICVIDHKHEDDCYEVQQILSCEAHPHQHTAACFRSNVPEGVDDVMGKAQAYAQSIEFTDYNNETMIHEIQAPVTFSMKKTGSKESTTPLDIAKYELMASLEYYDSNAETWVTIISGETIVPVNEKVRLTYHFQGLDLAALNAAGGYAKYQVPNPLRNNITDGALEDSDSNKIATVTRSDNNSVLFDFDDDWLQQIIEEGKTSLAGHFKLIVDIDPKVIGSVNNYEIIFEKSRLELILDEDWRAKQSTLEVEKSNASVIETDDGAYFEYTIEVTASSDGVDVEDVVITDTFTEKRQFISNYVGVEASSSILSADNPSIAPVETKPAGAKSGSVYLGKVTTDNTIPLQGSYTLANDPGTLVWQIDEMKAGETRTLTYRAKASDALILTSALKQNAHSIKNKANVFAKDYLRDSSESVYTTNNNFTSGFHHKFNQIITDDNGNQYIRFKLLLEAKSSNDFNYRNLRIRDELFPTHGAAKVTEEKYKPYLTLMEDSFRLYLGNVDINDYNTAAQIPIEESALSIDQEAKMFELNLGIFEPGECITLIYDVKLDKGAYTLSNNDFFIANTFITLNGNDNNAGSRLERFSNVANFKGKIWSRKTASDEATASITNIKITAGEEIYDNPGTLTQSTVSEFNVPAGAFKYFVIFNEDGKWDLSNATLTDTLGEYLRYSGYVKVNAYQVTNTSFSSAANADPSVVENFLKTQPLIKTVWMKIDGQQTFTFKPEQIGLDGRYAYTLEYYAQPHGLEDVSTASVSNTFTISGNVGDGVYVGGTGSIMVEKFVTITGQETFGVRKQGWYYEREVVDNTSKHWINGRLFWVIELEGTLKSGRQIKDVIPSAQQIYCGESVIGIYKGNLAGKSLEDYTSVEDFEQNANVEKLQGMFEGEEYNEDAYYTVDLIDNLEMLVTLNKNIPLSSGEFVYMIFAAEPKGTYAPDYSKLDIKTYNNSIYSRENDEGGWVHMTDASYNIATKGPVYKIYDGTTLVNKDGYIPVGDDGDYRFDKVLKEYVSDSAVYSEWYVNLNWNGEISGVAKMSDILPKGTELAYVRMFEIGSDYDSVGLALDKPVCLDIPELETDEWQKNTVTSLENNGVNTLKCTYYYNKETNEIRWNVGNLSSGGAKDERNVMFQIVTKAVSDELILTSSEVTMNNTIKVTDENGKETIDTATGSYTRNSLTKDTSDAYKQDDASFGNKIPFVIDVNTYGVDMNPDGDTLTMIDEPAAYLQFDTESIRVYEYSTTAKVSEEYENIASQAKVSTTGIIDNTGPASNLTDMKDNTLFKFHNSQMTSKQDVILTFDEVKLMNKFRIAFEKLGSDQYNYQFNFSIHAQNSAENEVMWDTIASHVTCNRTTDFEKVYTFVPKEYDKIKIEMHSCTTVNGFGWPAIAEFEIYGRDVLGGNVSNDYLDKTMSELPLSEWNAAIETKEDGTEILKITIPDDKWLRIEYTMEYRGPKGEAVSIFNNVRWDGMPSESGSSFEDSSFQYDIFGTVITNENSGIKIIKVDENNLRNYLEGAVFTVTECSVSPDGSILEIPSTVQTRTTDENGIAYFSSNNDYALSGVMPWMKFNTVYCLRETVAPEGYIVNPEPMYFVVAKQTLIDGEMAYPDFPDNVYVYTEKAIYEYTCRNSRGKIAVDKKFYINENKQTSLMDGTYSFGLYTEQNPISKPLQILKITIKDGIASYNLNGVGCQTPSFADIDVKTTTTYYIYELDSQNKPVHNSSFVKVDNVTYEVHYPDNRGIEVDGTTIPVKEVHNYLTFRLPESGGNGTTWYKAFGFALILFSTYIYIGRKQSKNKS